MLWVMFSVGRDALKWLLITSLVLVFIEIGPGGELVGSLVLGLKNTLLVIEWNVLYEAAIHDIQVLFQDTPASQDT